MLLRLTIVAVLMIGLTGPTCPELLAQDSSSGSVQLLPRVNGSVPTEECPIHKTQMKIAIVDVLPGVVNAVALPAKRSERKHTKLVLAYWQAKKLQFSETHWWLPADCGPVSTPRAEVLFCSECREAETRWVRANPGLVESDFEP